MSAPRHVQALLDRLHKVKRSGKGWVAICPAHDDSRQSLSIGIGSEQKILLNCHAGCSAYDVANALGLSISDLYAEARERRDEPMPRRSDFERRITAEYNYENALGAIAYQVVRLREPKEFRQRRPNGQGWVWGMDGVTKLPYRLPELIEDIANERNVCLCEGEKDVDRLRHYGIPATTTPGGSNAWRPDYAEYFRNSHVTLLPDHDKPGFRYAEEAANDIQATANSVRVLDLFRGRPLADKAGLDVSDWIQQGNDPLTIPGLADKAPLATNFNFHPPPLFFLTDSDIEARLPPEPFIDGIFDQGAFVVLAGPPGCGKSFMALDWALSAAAGITWASRPVHHGNVVYVIAEGVGGIGARVKAWKHHTGLNDQTLGVHFLTQSIQLMEEGDVNQLIQASEHLEPVLFVFDTLARLMGGDENKNVDMGRYIDGVDKIRARFDAACLSAHHMNAAGEKERGHTSLRGASDTLMWMKMKDGEITLECKKQKERDAFRLLRFKLEQSLSSAVLTPISNLGVNREQLTPTNIRLLSSLSSAALAEGLSASAWQAISEEPSSSFYRSRKFLHDNGFIERDKEGRGALYRLTQKGIDQLTPKLPTHSQLTPRE